VAQISDLYTNDAMNIIKYVMTNVHGIHVQHPCPTFLTGVQVWSGPVAGFVGSGGSVTWVAGPPGMTHTTSQNTTPTSHCPTS